MMTKYRKKPLVVEAEQFLSPSNPPDGVTPNENGLGYGIQTPEGRMDVNHTDWVIRGIRGELYPVKDDIFKASYEPLPEPGDDDDFTMPFGKHKGEKLSEIPTGYLEWILDNLDLRPELKGRTEEELNRRVPGQ